MLGAIIGDIIGSRFEWNNIKSKDFDLFTERSKFTDDTVLTIAIADALLQKKTYQDSVLYWGRKYPNSGYGERFMQWLAGGIKGPYNSWGNGSAMRVSPVGFTYNTETSVLLEAKKTAAFTHNHIEGIKGAQATALAIFLARNNYTKDEIKQKLTESFGYSLNRKLDVIRPNYQFDVSCQGSVPESIIAFLESTDYEDSIRNAISIGGDSHTIACITGGVAEAFYKEIPKHIVEKSMRHLPEEMKEVIDSFYQKLHDE